MKWNLVTASRPSPVGHARTATHRRRKVRPSLEFLERREVLSTFTWTGAAGDGSWDTDANWQGNVAPRNGLVDILLAEPDAVTSPPTIKLQTANAGIQIQSLGIQGGGTYTLIGPSAGANQSLTLAPNAAITLTPLTPSATGYLIVGTTSGAGANSLALNFQGDAKVAGEGDLTLNNGSVTYANNPASLRTFTVDTSRVFLGASANYSKSRFGFVGSAILVVADGADATVGSVGGDGIVQVGATGNQPSTTGLTISTPAGEDNTLAGPVINLGGTLTKTGAGKQSIRQFSPLNPANASLNVQAGDLGISGASHVTRATFAAGTTFSTPIWGTANNQAGKITANGTNSPVSLAGNLAVALTNGYSPELGDTISIVSSPNGITGQFANAANNGLIYPSNAPTTAFRVNYTANAVTLKAVQTTSIQVQSSKNPSAQGEGVTFTATVTGGASPVGVGTVTFFAGANQIGGPVAVDANGVAISPVVSNLPVGDSNITARYNAAENYIGSTSLILVQKVNAAPQAQATSTQLQSSKSPSAQGEGVTFTATVTGGASPVGVGTVTFFAGANQIGGPVAVNANGVAISPVVSNLPVGDSNITARYSGASNFLGSTSAILKQTVNAVPVASNTTTSLQALTPSTFVGQAASFQAIVRDANNAAVTAGAVQFHYNNGQQWVLLGSVPLDAQGRAVLSTSILGVGNTPVVATYVGVANSYNSSQSGGVAQAVNAYPTTSSLALTNQSVRVGRRQQRTYYLTASIRSSIPGGPGLSGQVVFKNNGAPIGVAQVVDGIARWAVGRQAPRRGSFTAEFVANGTFTGSVSNTLSFGRQVRPRRR